MGRRFLCADALARRGLGHRLQSANQAAHELFFSLGMAEASRAIKWNVGAGSFRPMTLFARVARVRADEVSRAVEREVRRRTGPRVGAALRSALG